MKERAYKVIGYFLITLIVLECLGLGWCLVAKVNSRNANREVQGQACNLHCKHLGFDKGDVLLQQEGDHMERPWKGCLCTSSKETGRP